MIVWASTYYAVREELVRAQERRNSLIEQGQALEARLQEEKDEVSFWKTRSRDEREQKERAIDTVFQIKHQHPGVQKDPEEVYQKQLEGQDTMFDESQDVLASQHAHMAKHGAASLLREELSGFSEPDDGFDRLPE